MLIKIIGELEEKVREYKKKTRIPHREIINLALEEYFKKRGGDDNEEGD